jgi:hypothetical protein
VHGLVSTCWRLSITGFLRLRIEHPASRGDSCVHIAHLLRDEAAPFVKQHPFLRQAKAARPANYTTTPKPEVFTLPPCVKMRGLKDSSTASSFCRSFDELRNFLRPRSSRNQHVPANHRRLHILSRSLTVISILKAA